MILDKIYVISLSKCIEKRKRITQQFEKITLTNWSFFDAIDGFNLSNHQFTIPNWFDPTTGKAITNGEIGCALSHHSIWSIIANNNSPNPTLILEDDIIFLDNFMENLKNYISELVQSQPNYDMLYIHRKPLELSEEISISKHINIAKKSYWACGYILTCSGAKKLLSSNYLSNLIPVDEFLPIMYGCTVNGFEKLFKQFTKLDCFAITPSLLDLVDDAFLNSNTYHSAPYLYTPTSLEFAIFYEGKTDGDIYYRFVEYCAIYGIPLVGREQLKDSTLVVCIFDGEYSILPFASPNEILEKVSTIIKENKDIIISPCSNIFCTYAHNLSGGKTKKYFDFREQIFFKITDEKENNFMLDYKKSRIVIPSKIMPSFVIFDKKSAQTVNMLENYTGNGWNQYYGCNGLDGSNISLNHTIYIAIRQKSNIPKFNYPNIFINLCDFPPPIEKFLESNCEYFMFINNNCVITNPNILHDLLYTGKNIVAPLLKVPNKTWANFWGALDEDGYYQRSFDYLDIIENKRRGCWNVPFVMDAYLIKREILEKYSNLYSKNTNPDLDVRFCQNLRDLDIFMYVCNLGDYGYLEQELTIYDIFDRREEWENKYLHSKFLENRNKTSDFCQELCNDIYNFPLFSQIFCSELISEVEKYGKWSRGHDEHYDSRLGENYYENVPTVDVQLFEINFSKHWDKIVEMYIAPMAKILYYSYVTKGVHLAFVVKYHIDNQSSLAPHHDASVYTVNIALNSEYEGGGCRFIKQNYVLKNQEPGMCCMHPGRLTAYHEGLPVMAGVRYILVSFIN